jgi:kynurenine 3-monooxygenase
MNADANVPKGDGSTFKIPFNTQTFYTIKSKFTGARDAISLGVLPSKPGPTRTFNVIRIPEHDIWKIRNGNELREWFAKSFPRFDFSTDSSLVTQAEFDRFAETEGLSLPPCQYSPELYVASPTTAAKRGAVILVGDSVHTFPPDLGEGVNSGLEDVFVLDEILSKHENIGDAAKEYAFRRGPEVRFFCGRSRYNVARTMILTSISDFL